MSIGKGEPNKAMIKVVYFDEAMSSQLGPTSAI